MSTAMEDRFWARVAPDGDCWLWRGSTAGAGYGEFAFTTPSGRSRHYAHRWSYEHMVAEIPEGLELDHLCRNRLCVNPNHLDPVTHAVNRFRSRGFKSGPRDLGPTCRHGHERTSDNTGVNAHGHQFCRPCARIRTQRNRAKRLANPTP